MQANLIHPGPNTGESTKPSPTGYLPGQKPVRPVVAAAPVRKRQQFALRFLILMGLGALALFIYWLADQRFAGFRPLYYLLLVSIGYRVLKVLFEWYHYWAIQQPPPPPPLTRKWTVDMLTTAMPGEPYELIKDTLEAMVAVRYPHTTFLCDEGNDPQLKALCDRLGVRHMTRTVKVDAKAGNINNALRSATGEICVVLDPDHRPVPQMLDEVLPYFEDESIGFVQSVQAYKNAGDSPVARGAAEQTYTFYGPMMMGMSTYGTAQAIGANCVFRRAALDSIGGHAAGLSEDMHTAMQLHAKGWKSVYLPKILTRGLVPSNMGAYYKQQLKWSRGTFELLFMVLPTIFRQLTWRQKLHYSLIPLHFAAGIIALIDILIPLLALATGEVPLLLEFSKAYLYLVPFLVMIILVRQYAQRWLLEKRERGFHLTGGVLLFGSWWVLLVGFVYTLFRVKVPYIPTPKDDEYVNHYKLCVPNLLVVALSACVITLSLRYDANPYNLLMAAYASVNAVFLLISVWMGQDRWRHWLKRAIKKVKPMRWLLTHTSAMAGRGAAAGFALLRQKAIALSLLFTAVTALLGWQAAHPVDPVEISANKNLGGFYLGVHLGEVEGGSMTAGKQNGVLPKGANMVLLHEYWGGGNTAEQQALSPERLAQQHVLPVIEWLPAYADGSRLPSDSGIMKAIAKGVYDTYLEQYALRMRSIKAPVIISFAPESDNPAKPWFVNCNNPVRDYIRAFRHVQVVFLQAGVNNVTWMWNLRHPGNMRVMYPGDGFVDWVGVSHLDMGSGGFKKAFMPYHRQLKKVAKPVLLTRLAWNSDQASVSRIREIMDARAERFSGISGMVLHTMPGAQGSTTAVRWAGGSLSSDMLADVIGQLPELAVLRNETTVAERSPAVHGRQLTGTAGNFRLLYQGRPFYIKGIAYNPEQSWRDGFHPLNRQKVETDFKAIKAMGANTIRRYAPSANDANILEVAAQTDLKVMYGFWFDPEVDYAKDKRKVAAYIRKVERVVRKYKNREVILAWNIGNESSGLLKHHFAQPYLTVVRRAYMAMIETMARRVHAIDPDRAVLTSLEHARQLPGEIHSFSVEAPSVDVIAINSYYKQWIGQVHDMVHRMSPGKPYLISEFGAKGYWEENLNDLDQHYRLLEQSDRQKALLFASEWKEDVHSHAGCNVGGIAFCWQDRYEGTATWFGLTDHKGRKKLPYFSLQQVWSGKPAPAFESLFLMGPTFTIKPGGTYEFTAVYNGSEPLSNMEWQLLSSDYLEPAGKIVPGSAPNKVRITFPSEGRNFRLYLHAPLRGGRVITASRPVTLFQGVFNEGI